MKKKKNLITLIYVVLLLVYFMRWEKNVFLSFFKIGETLHFPFVLQSSVDMSLTFIIYMWNMPNHKKYQVK